jgi:hypothetical protein
MVDFVIGGADLGTAGFVFCGADFVLAAFFDFVTGLGGRFGVVRFLVVATSLTTVGKAGGGGTTGGGESGRDDIASMSGRVYTVGTAGNGDTIGKGDRAAGNGDSGGSGMSLVMGKYSGLGFSSLGSSHLQGCIMAGALLWRLIPEVVGANLGPACCRLDTNASSSAR